MAKAMNAVANVSVSVTHFRRPEESQDDDREEFWEEKEAREADDSSDEGEIEPSEEHKKELKSFEFLFNHN